MTTTLVVGERRIRAAHLSDAIFYHLQAEDGGGGTTPLIQGSFVSAQIYVYDSDWPPDRAAQSAVASQLPTAERIARQMHCHR